MKPIFASLDLSFMRPYIWLFFLAITLFTFFRSAFFLGFLLRGRKLHPRPFSSLFRAFLLLFAQSYVTFFFWKQRAAFGDRWIVHIYVFGSFLGMGAICALAVFFLLKRRLDFGKKYELRQTSLFMISLASLLGSKLGDLLFRHLWTTSQRAPSSSSSSSSLPFSSHIFFHSKISNVGASLLSWAAHIFDLTQGELDLYPALGSGFLVFFILHFPTIRPKDRSRGWFINTPISELWAIFFRLFFQLLAPLSLLFAFGYLGQYLSGGEHGGPLPDTAPHWLKYLALLPFEAKPMHPTALYRSIFFIFLFLWSLRSVYRGRELLTAKSDISDKGEDEERNEDGDGDGGRDGDRKLLTFGEFGFEDEHRANHYIQKKVMIWWLLFASSQIIFECLRVDVHRWNAGPNLALSKGLISGVLYVGACFWLCRSMFLSSSQTELHKKVGLRSFLRPTPMTILWFFIFSALCTFLPKLIPLFGLPPYTRLSVTQISSAFILFFCVVFSYERRRSQLLRSTSH